MPLSSYNKLSMHFKTHIRNKPLTNNNQPHPSTSPHDDQLLKARKLYHQA